MQNTKMTGLQFFAESAVAEPEAGAGVNTSSTAVPVSQRLGHVTALESPRHSIHFRDDAGATHEGEGR